MSNEKDERTLWVGNVNPKATKKLLYELFLQAGPLDYVALPEFGGRKKPYAFVIFKHKASVPYTIDLMRGIRLFGDELILNEKNKDKQQQNGHQRGGRNYSPSKHSNSEVDMHRGFPPNTNPPHVPNHNLMELQAQLLSRQLYNQQIMAQRELQRQAANHMRSGRMDYGRHGQINRSFSSPAHLHEINDPPPRRGRADRRSRPYHRR